MSTREMAHNIVDNMTTEQLNGFILLFSPEMFEVPNEETLEAFAEVDEMRRSGSGDHFSGSTTDYFNALLEG